MKFRKVLMKVGMLANCLALALVVQGANTTCAWVVHQPKFPEGADKFKKVK